MNAARLDAIRTGLAPAGLAGALLTRPEHIWWLSGAEAAGMAVVVAESEARLATADGLGDALSDLGLAGPGAVLGIDGGPRAAAASALRTADARTVLAAARRRKDAGEVAELERAARVVDDALAAARSAAVPGATDHAVLAAAASTLEDAAGPAAVLEACVGAGPSGADPDAVPAGVTLREDDWVFVDLFPRVGRYYGDATRVFAASAPTEQAERLHATLWDALEQAAAALAPGVAAAEVDARCRAVLAAAHLDRYFPHHTGHGLGLFQQEAPLVAPGSDDVLAVGDVVTLEPGVYLPGVGGMRVEDVFVIEDGGARRITGAPRALSKEALHG